MSDSGPLPVVFGADGLVPAVIRDADSGDVLMVGFMNEEALGQTRATGLVHFWSRSRQRLWKKGETSGHVQSVQAIYLNCDRNSLLLDVEQEAAVCHDGYPSCFYRRLEPDNSLATVRDRWFDPADVYDRSPRMGIAALTQLQIGAYEFLRDHELSTESNTSSLLRQTSDEVTDRLADELEELAGVLDGTHRHVECREDVTLEAGQVAYWLLLRCVRAGVTWDDLRPDRALDIELPAESIQKRLLAQLLRETADKWRTERATGAAELAPQAHATLHMAAQACTASGVSPRVFVERDVEELRRRQYLATYFASADEV